MKHICRELRSKKFCM